MNYQNPQLLYALFAIAIPIILHLFNLRKYKTVRFSSIRFLKEIKQAKRSRSNLKNLLILISRILAITFLVIAFAKPYIPSNNHQKEVAKSIFFYIDNSFSMESVSEDGSLFEIAKNKAEQISNQYDSQTEFYLITNDFSAKHSHAFSKSEIVKMIGEVSISSKHKTISDVLNRQKSLNKNQQRVQLFIFSDLQKSTLGLEDITSTDTSAKVFILPLSANSNSNLYIDSCWTNSPIIQVGKPIEITARVVNKSDIGLENIPAFLHVNKQQKAISNFSILPQESKIIAFNFSPANKGLKECIISLQDYPISFDDKFYFSFEILSKIDVLNVYNESNKSLQTLFSEDEMINYKSVAHSNINYEEIKENNLLILNGLNEISSGLMHSIEIFVKEGGSLIIFPNENIDFESYHQLTSLLKMDSYVSIDTNSQDVNIINYKHKVFEGVFEKEETKINLPKVYSHYKFSNKNNSLRQSILTLESGDDFIRHYNYFSGDIYQFSSSLSSSASNFEKHALFVPILYNISLISYKLNNLYYTIDDNSFFNTPTSKNTSTIYHLKSDNLDIIPAERFVGGKKQLFVSELLNAGNYSLTSDDETIDVISFNYSAQESDPLTYTIDEIKNIFKRGNLQNFNINESNLQDVREIVKKINLGKSYWKHCIILTLLFLLIEILLVKFLKS